MQWLDISLSGIRNNTVNNTKFLELTQMIVNDMMASLNAIQVYIYTAILKVCGLGNMGVPGTWVIWERMEHIWVGIIEALENIEELQIKEISTRLDLNDMFVTGKWFRMIMNWINFTMDNVPDGQLQRFLDLICHFKSI